MDIIAMDSKISFFLVHNFINNGCPIFCNGGENISLNSNHNHHRLFRCTHGCVYQSDVLNRQSASYREFLIPKIGETIDQRVNLYQLYLNLLNHLIIWNKIVPIHFKSHLIKIVLYF